MSRAEIAMFIYGTLMRGEPFHHLLGAARFVAPARTSPGFALVDLGEYPALVREGSGQVHGQLFEVPRAQLPRLDAYEDCPGLYTRETVALALPDGVSAQAYLIDAGRLRGRPRIASGAWRPNRSSDL